MATDTYIGGGDGAGGSLTFKWEPSDNVGVKWRTEYSKDNYDVSAQALLNDQNTIVDLNTVAPRASSCTGPGADGLVGPLDDGSCAQKWSMRDDDNDGIFTAVQSASETFALNQYFANSGADLGQYDPNNPPMSTSTTSRSYQFFKGTIPKADGLRPTLNPELPQHQ